MIRMSPVTPPERGTIIADTDLRQFAAGTGDGEVTGERGSDGLRAVRYALLEAAEDPDEFGLILDWDGARQAFVGHAPNHWTSRCSDVLKPVGSALPLGRAKRVGGFPWQG